MQLDQDNKDNKHLITITSSLIVNCYECSFSPLLPFITLNKDRNMQAIPFYISSGQPLPLPRF